MSKGQNDKSRPRIVDSADDKDFPESAISLLHLVSNNLFRGEKAKIGESSPNLGMSPLFPSKRDINSSDCAYAKACELLRAKKIEVADLDWLEPELVMVAQRYWVQHDRDSRVTSSDMKAEVTQLRTDLAKVIKRLDELPLATRQALNADVRSQLPKLNGPSPDYVAELHQSSSLMQAACEPISSKKNIKVRRSFRFQRCAADLWAMREKITGKPISQVFELQKGSFTTDDAAFVNAIMKAIDENVTASQVQDGLRRAAQAKKKRK